MLNNLNPNLVNTICGKIFEYVNSDEMLEEFASYEIPYYNTIEYYSYNRRLITSLNSLMIFNPEELRDVPVGLLKIKFIISIDGKHFDYATILVNNFNNDLVISLKDCTNENVEKKLVECLGSLNFYKWLIEKLK